MKITVVGPAYNEQDNISLFVEKTHKALIKLGVTAEILIIDDASTDRTFRVANSLTQKYKELRILRNSQNLGLTGTSWRGFLEAKGKFIVLLSTDLETDPEEDIPKLFQKLNEGWDMVVGWRYNKKHGLVKRIISKIFNVSADILFGVRLHDLGWIKIFKRNIIYEIPALRSDWHRLFPILVAHYGYRVAEIKTEFHDRKHGKSSHGKFGLARIPGGFMDMVALKFQLSFSKRPMLFFGFSGIFMFLIGIFIGLYVIYLNFTRPLISDRAPLILLVIVFILAGIQLFAVGFLAEYMASIQSEIRRK